MMPEPAADQGDFEEEQPAPRHVLDDPEIQTKIKAALERVEQGRSRRGKTADDLLKLAREQRGLDP
jgi:hypothetical protein